MSDKETVCAVVVTYNRKELLIECLEALQKQTRPLDTIYLIDNASTDETPELLLEKGYIDELPPNNDDEPWEQEFKIKNLINGDIVKVHYVRMNENTGGAGGFHEGIKRAYKRGYDWLWLMDDDVEPFSNGLENLLNFKHISSCIHGSKIYPNGELVNWNGWLDDIIGVRFEFEENFKDKNFCIINFGCFEGLLIHKDIINKIGYPFKKFFIIADDTYYGYLASKYTNVIYIKDIVLKAKIDKRQYKESLSRRCLFIRNYLYLFRKITKFSIIPTVRYLFNATKASIKYRSHLPLLAYYDGIMGNFERKYK